MSNIPVINDHPQYITQPEDKEPVIPDNVIKDHHPVLSQNMKLSMRHLGADENAISVSEEWKFVNGVAVAPVGRDATQKYTKTQAQKYSAYGDITIEKVKPYGDSDPAGEVCDNIKVTSGTQTTNDDTDFVEAVPVLAVERSQEHLIKGHYRRGEVNTDPIDNENYLDRPGMEVKTSNTYMASLSESESESEDDMYTVRTIAPQTTTATTQTTKSKKAAASKQ